MGTEGSEVAHTQHTVAARAARLRALVQELIDGAAAVEEKYADRIAKVRPEHRLSAQNLIHYVWLRGRDIREMQAELAELGLSSLGRLEARVMPTLKTLARTLDLIAGDGAPDEPGHEGMPLGPALLERNAANLLGKQPLDRASRIMVTFPSEAAKDPALVRRMVEAGMDIARINCAHDGPDEWAAMIGHLRDADPRWDAETEQRTEIDDGVRPAPDRSLVAMDLSGPKLRTGPIAAGAQVLKAKPQRDETGRVEQPAIVVLESGPADHQIDAGTRVPVTDETWLAEREIGEKIRFTDARGRNRELLVTDIVEDPDRLRVVTEMRRTAYFVPGLRFEDPRGGEGIVDELPSLRTHHLVRAGERIVLTRSLDPHEPQPGGPHLVGCTLGQVFDDAKPGQRIFFDDGKIDGVITHVEPDRIDVDVVHAGADGVKLRPEKGINLPDTSLDMPALTDEDIAALPFICEHADIVNYSFVRDARDVADLLDRVEALGRDDLDVVLKIETVEAFRNLPQILLEAMRWRDIGVMIARGDLAVEAGFERLAEVQEEILWLCEAAHIPVIWATQVLESLAKDGLVTRAEVTDAAMSKRAECVMLNKGPFIVDAIEFLRDVLQRMQQHVWKKQTLLRRLRSWDLAGWSERP